MGDVALIKNSDMSSIVVIIINQRLLTPTAADIKFTSPLSRECCQHVSVLLATCRDVSRLRPKLFASATQQGQKESPTQPICVVLATQGHAA